MSQVKGTGAGTSATSLEAITPKLSAAPTPAASDTAQLHATSSIPSPTANDAPLSPNGIELASGQPTAIAGRSRRQGAPDRSAMTGSDGSMPALGTSTTADGTPSVMIGPFV